MLKRFYRKSRNSIFFNFIIFFYFLGYYICSFILIFYISLLFNENINESIYSFQSLKTPIVLFFNFYTGFLHVLELLNGVQDDFIFFFILFLCLVKFSLIPLIIFNFKTLNFRNKQTRIWILLNGIFFICLYFFILFLLKFILKNLKSY